MTRTTTKPGLPCLLCSCLTGRSPLAGGCGCSVTVVAGTWCAKCGCPMAGDPDEDDLCGCPAPALTQPETRVAWRPLHGGQIDAPSEPPADSYLLPGPGLEDLIRRLRPERTR